MPYRKKGWLFKLATNRNPIVICLILVLVWVASVVFWVFFQPAAR